MFAIIIYPPDGEPIELNGTGYAVRCAAQIAETNIPDALWALEVLTKYGHLVPHPSDRYSGDSRLRSVSGQS